MTDEAYDDSPWTRDELAAAAAEVADRADEDALGGLFERLASPRAVHLVPSPGTPGEG